MYKLAYLHCDNSAWFVSVASIEKYNDGEGAAGCTKEVYY